MKLKFSAFLFLALFFSSAFSFASEIKNAPVDLQFEVNAQGDVLEGREAFKRLKCNDCHRVLGDAALGKPASGEPAPVLGGLNKEHTIQELADAILMPSHSFAPGFKPTSAGQSRMSEMKPVITVKELLDIIAYLKTCEQLDAPWPKEEQN